MRRQTMLFLAGMLWAPLACATVQTPEQRYLHALSQKYEGDAQTYYEEMLKLAADDSGTRAGRRARALLHGNRWLADAAIFGALASALTPLPAAKSASLLPSAVEAKQMLNAIAAAQGHFFGKHKRFCKSFAECGVQAPAKAHYFYFLRPDEVMGGSDSENTVELESQVRALMDAKHIRPFVEAARYFAVAVGSNDDETELDAWAINERGTLIHLVGDTTP